MVAEEEEDEEESLEELVRQVNVQKRIIYIDGKLSWIRTHKDKNMAVNRYSLAKQL